MLSYGPMAVCVCVELWSDECVCMCVCVELWSDEGVCVCVCVC